ncbi:MAG: hypothetical protein ACI4PK_01810 [Oscillospiraceae bacterium]
MTNCSTKKQTAWPDAKNKEKPYYNTEQYQPTIWEADTLWSQKIKMLSDAKIPSFDNLQELEKKYVLNLARYLQSMSPEGLLYDDKKQKYVISEADVQYFAKNLLGIEAFSYKESDEYNEKDAIYECTEYPSYGFVNRVYENKRIEKLSDSIWKFSVDVKENNEKNQKPITEVYTVQDDANGYRMLSVKRIDSEGKEVTNAFKEDVAEI